MNTLADASPQASARLLGEAVHRSSAFSLAGLHERAFTLAFRGLVYPQIWEDPPRRSRSTRTHAAVAHRHHRFGRLQRDELPHGRSREDRGRGPQCHPRRPQQAQARGAEASPRLRLVLPLLRRCRQRSQRRRVRPAPAQPPRRRHPRLLGADEPAGPPARHALRPRLPPLRAARPLHRRRSSARPPLRQGPQEHARRPHARGPAAHLPHGAGTVVRQTLRALAAGASPVPLRPRHPAGAVRLPVGGRIDHRRCRPRPPRETRLRFRSRRQLFRLAGLQSRLRAGRSGSPSPVSAGRQFRCASGSRASGARRADLDDRIPGQPAGRLPGPVRPPRRPGLDVDPGPHPPLAANPRAPPGPALA